VFLFLYLDEDSCDTRLVAALLRFGIQVLLGTGGGRGAFADSRQLEFALSIGWPIVTANYKDFARMQAAWGRAGREHPGIIIWRRERWRPEPLAAALYEICSTRTQGQFRNTVIWL
jgi:hypothetical protein